MANKEQLSILKQGIRVWNRWRKENPDVEVDLSKVELREAKLRKANLKNADLVEADLSGAWLHKANSVMANS